MRIMNLCLLYVFLLTVSSTTFPVLCKSNDEALMLLGHGFTHVPRVLESGSTIKTLCLAHNSIGRVQTQDFLHYPNLTCLDLRFNRISFIHHGSLSSLSGLTDLLLGNNRILSHNRLLHDWPIYCPWICMETKLVKYNWVHLMVCLIWEYWDWVAIVLRFCLQGFFLGWNHLKLFTWKIIKSGHWQEILLEAFDSYMS